MALTINSAQYNSGAEYETVTGEIVTIDNAKPYVRMKQVVCEINPVQDLHGYDNPWPAGGGKNKLTMTVSDIKSVNTSGSWSGNTYTHNNVAFTVLTDSDGNVTGIRANGTASARADFNIMFSIPTGEYIVNGITNGSDSTYFVAFVRSSPTYELLTYIYSGDSSAISLTSGDTYTYGLRIASGYNASNVMFYPMIRLASVSDATFAPYSNICPISGWSNAKVTRTGKNLMPFNLTSAVSAGGATLTPTGDGGFIVSGTTTATTSIIVWNTESATGGTASAQNPNKKTVPNGTYKFTGQGNGVSFQLRGSNTENADGATVGNSANTTVTVDDTYKYNWFRVALSAGTYNNVVVYPMLRLASEADATYEPHNGQTVTISLGGTRYGGTLDVTRGKLTVKMAFKDMGDISWSYSSATQRMYSTDINSVVKRPATNNDLANIICEMYATATANDTTSHTVNNAVAVGDTGVLYVYDPSYTDPIAFTAAVSGKKIVYELATPIEVNLTPTEIKTLLGQNNVWTDTNGEVTVVYMVE